MLSDVPFLVGILLRKSTVGRWRCSLWGKLRPSGANSPNSPRSVFGGICKHIWACWYNFQKLHPHRCLDILWLVVWNIFYVPLIPGKRIQFDEHICSNGLVQPPTSSSKTWDYILMVFSMCVVFFCKSFFVLRWFRWFLGYPCQPPNTSKSGWVLWPMKARWLSVSWWRITHTNTLKNSRVSVVVFRSEVICRVRV